MVIGGGTVAVIGGGIFAICTVAGAGAAET
jgi:hypothetical protein